MSYSVGSATTVREDDRWYPCWVGFAVALSLLLWVDLATTLAAAGQYGLEFEANPIMRGLLESGVLLTMTIHLLIFIAALVGFGTVVRIGQSLEGKSANRYRYCCYCWIGVLLIVGIGVAVNNLALVLVALIG